jgi:hypothetical protein
MLDLKLVNSYSILRYLIFPKLVLTTAPTKPDNFVIGQFETQPPNSFPLEATIVNVSLSETTPIPS